MGQADDCPSAENHTDIQRLARTLWSANYRKDGVFVMLAYASYWDASYDPKAKITVVAGAAGPVWVWEKCEIDWRLALAKFDVPYLHMKEFIYFVGPYSTPAWKSEGRRAEFLALMAKIVGTATMVGISRLVSQSTFDKANEKYELDRKRQANHILGAAEFVC
jgi:hypothetical protein